MERDRLVQVAPQYYKCAICAYFSRKENHIASSTTLWNQAGYPQSDYVARTGGMKNGPLFFFTLNDLVTNGFLSAMPDDFGPTIYTRTEEFTAKWDELKKEEGTPYYKWHIDPAGNTWLINALDAVNKALEQQKITNADLVKPDTEWEPLPIDRENPKLKEVADALNKTIEAVQQDNGYNATLPEEKSFVVENLTEVAEKLKKDDAISFAYLKRKAIDSLDVLIRRFGKASVGLVASAARAAIFDWIKEIGSHLFHWL